MVYGNSALQAQLLEGPRFGPRPFEVIQYMGELMDQGGILNPGGNGQIEVRRVVFPGLPGINQNGALPFRPSRGIS